MQAGEPLADGPIMMATARIGIMRIVTAKATSTFIEKDRVATDEHRRLGDVGRDPPRLVFREQLGR
jgi:hypothetical protein